jgi:hypothetical protein
MRHSEFDMMALQTIPVVPSIIAALLVWHLVEEAVSAALRVVRFGLLFFFVVALVNGRSRRLMKLAHRPIVGALRRAMITATRDEGFLFRLLRLRQGSTSAVNREREASSAACGTERATAPKS